MIQLEHDYHGQDFSVNVKAMNPSPNDLTGVYMASYLQSITKNLAVGFDSFYQRPNPKTNEFHTSYLAKLTSTDKRWIATAQLQPSGVLQATYWHKLSEKVEVAADLQVLAAPTRRDAIATLGAKYDFRVATFRAQVDSTGKVSALLEQRFVPAFAFLVAGEIDHFKVCPFHCRVRIVYLICLLERCQSRCWCDDGELELDARGDGHDATTLVLSFTPNDNDNLL